MKAYARHSERPALKKFKLSPKYAHHRSDGLTRRRNKGSAPQPEGRPA